LLHPDPVVAIDCERLFPIPFLVVTNWPLKLGDTIGLDWRVPKEDPHPFKFLHHPPQLSDRELKGDQQLA
jgi:hypothetical protein